MKRAIYLCAVLAALMFGAAGAGELGQALGPAPTMHRDDQASAAAVIPSGVESRAARLDAERNLSSVFGRRETAQKNNSARKDSSLRPGHNRDSTRNDKEEGAARDADAALQPHRLKPVLPSTAFGLRLQACASGGASPSLPRLPRAGCARGAESRGARPAPDAAAPGADAPAPGPAARAGGGDAYTAGDDALAALVLQRARSAPLRVLSPAAYASPH